jgi:hypothetical protein
MTTTTNAAPICEKCGNDGSEGALYLAIDARWNPATGRWALQERDDAGGRAWDCLACDHTTEADGPAAFFPYGAEISPNALAANNDENGQCQSCGRDNRGHETEPCSDDCPQYWEERGISHPDHAADLEEASAGYKCGDCGREESQCSASPCEAVEADREG